MKTLTANILVVEDDAALSDVYQLVLRKHGFTVAVASNGVKAFEALKKFKPDLILLDYFMPVMDGKTFLMNFDESKFPNVKIIVATNVSDQAVLHEMLELGAHSYVLKAKLSPSQLVTLVQDSIQ